MNDSPTWDRVQALFGEALDLQPQEREALLDFTARTDPALAGEVRSLLHAHHEASGFLAGSAVGNLARTFVAGDRIGPYRIIGETGRGGMGVVFRAIRDDENFTKEVAVKLIYPGLQSADILRRFRAERQILALLDHPLIARLIDGGTAPDGSPFLVMDYVDGKPLLDYCDSRQLGIEERLGIFLDVCGAVQFAHQRLVIHRDLKPDNILVTADGSPRLLDFGIAKLLSPGDERRTATVTAPMNRILTPEYASPEQIRGEAVTISGDVYSLGVILYELLSGCRPLDFTTRTPEEILRVISRDDPVRPSTAVTRTAGDLAAGRRGETKERLRRRLAGDLDFIAMRALEKDPARRYGSVEQLTQDIRRHLDGLPVLARGHSTAYLVSRFVRRHRGAVMAAGFLALSLVAGLAGTAWQAGVARRERDRANRRFDEVRSLAHSVMFDIHDEIANLPGSTKARETLVDHALRYLNGLRPDAIGDPALEHELGLAYAKVADVQGRPMFSNLGRSAEALENYNRGITLLKSAVEARPESLSYARNLMVTTQRLADLLKLTGRDAEAMEQAATAMDGIEALRMRFPDDPYLPGDLLLTHDRIGDWKLAAADTQGAVIERKYCMDLAEQMFRQDPSDAGWRRSIIINCCKTADLMASRNDRDETMVSYRRAERLGLEAVAALGNNTEARRDLSIVYGLMGLFLANGGELDSGLAVYDLGMSISEEMAAQDPHNALMQSDVATGHFEIGAMLFDAHRYEAAEPRFQEAFERFSRLVAADTANVEARGWTARSGRFAGLACAELAGSARSARERTHWRALAIDWIERSLDLYRALDQQGALSGDDAAVPNDMATQLLKLRAGR